MKEQGAYTISTQDLIRSMVKLGERKKAREIGKEYLNAQELKVALSTSISENNLTDNLAQIVRYITEAKQKVICKLEKKQLILYAPKTENLLVEVIEHKKHTFYFQPLNSDLTTILEAFYDLGNEQENSIIPYAIKIDSNFYDLIHTMTVVELENYIEEEVDQLIKEEKAEPIKNFLNDFKANKQKTNPVVFMYDNRINSMEFFFPGEDCIWFIEYSNIGNDEVTVASITSEQYFQAVVEKIRIFFTEYLASKENRMTNKLFLFKRGVPFYMKSNILLIVFWVLLFINKSSWAYDGSTLFVFNIIQSEVLVIFLSFLACFRRESIKLKDIK